jgi:outer membrane biosynthesis protein TonB
MTEVAHMRKFFGAVALLLISVFAVSARAQISSGSAAGKQGERSSSKDHSLFIESNPEPELPRDMVADIDLAVTLLAIFQKSGKITDIKVISSRVPASMPAETLKKLEQATVDAAKKIRFAPPTKNGHRVSVRVELEYTFRRQNKQKHSNWRPTLIAE